MDRTRTRASRQRSLRPPSRRRSTCAGASTRRRHPSAMEATRPCRRTQPRLLMQPSRTLRINRAPVLTLWAAVVAERLGMPREAALTVGQALAGLTAYSKGVRLGIYAPPPIPSGVKTVRDVHLLGRLVHVAETPAG